jgi:sugar phosphate isomerase/epimerase
VVRPVVKQQFGISTGLYLGQRLQRAHLLEIASHGLDAVEVMAVPDHVDCTNPAVVADLQQWLAEAGLALHTIAVPAGRDEAAAEAALHVARRIPVTVLALHVGPPKQAARIVERLAESAAPLGVTIAVDSRSESMKPIGSLAHFVERGVDAAIGVALDCATAHQGGGSLVDAIETVSEHLATVRAPVESTIDWPAVLTTLRKVGYEGPLMFDAGPRGAPRDQLRRARDARRRLEKLWADD